MNDAQSKQPVTIYTTVFCSYCHGAKRLLDEKGVEYEAIDLTDRPDFREFLTKLTGQRTVPQILVHGEAIGGFNELVALEQSGELDRMIEEGMEETPADA